jgi:hypothetical protein
MHFDKPLLSAAPARKEVSMSVRRFLTILALTLSLSPALLAEIPLPDHTFYGLITTPGGAPVSSGVVKARVRRGQSVVLEATGSFVDAKGGPWYVVNVPLETAIGAPGPSGVAAREGDVLDALLLDGRPLELRSAVPALRAGGANQVDATGGSGGLLFFRGDCSPDRSLNIADAVRILNFLFTTPGAPPCLEACDSDGSGALNITDAVYTLNFLFLGGPALPAPGPACGVAPTPSALGCVQSSCV